MTETSATTFGPVTDYLPHRPPMLLVDRIDEVTKQSVTCRATIRPDCVFVQNGLVHPSAMIELVAQACAIYVGVTNARDGERPQLGFIAGCREISFAVDSLAVGDELTIVATKILGERQLAAFTGTVSRRGELCVTIELSVVDGTAAQLTSAGTNE
jgi:predicted hotdog family 3-hydroxylacyl-ACP dehydratase